VSLVINDMMYVCLMFVHDIFRFNSIQFNMHSFVFQTSDAHNMGNIADQYLKVYPVSY